MRVSFSITPHGGHLSQVRFRLGNKIVEPFSTAPWCGRPEVKKTIPLLRELRGDFFCMPFGDGPPWRGEAHPPHGQTANDKWHIQSADGQRIVATMQTKVRAGKITKTIEARADETNLYQLHELEGFKGRMCLGHHAMLDFNRNGPGRISMSKLKLAQVLPAPFENPAQGGYSSLKQGAWFRRLDSVPLAVGGKTDLSRFPAREGFEDLVMIHHKQTDDFAWSAVVFPEKNFIWFALKNPRHLASTVLWHSNGGRHYPPWNGRHRGVLGIEDVTAYFHLGLAASLADNPWQDKGVATSIAFKSGKSTVIPYIIGVCPLPAGFDVVSSITRADSGICLKSASGMAVNHTVDTSFIK